VQYSKGRIRTAELILQLEDAVRRIWYRKSGLSTDSDYAKFVRYNLKVQHRAMFATVDIRKNVSDIICKDVHKLLHS
jgi:hypothetical protein